MYRSPEHEGMFDINGQSWSHGDAAALDVYAAWESTLLIGGVLRYVRDPFESSARLFFSELPAGPMLMAIAA